MKSARVNAVKSKSSKPLAEKSAADINTPQKKQVKTSITKPQNTLKTTVPPAEKPQPPPQTMAKSKMLLSEADLAKVPMVRYEKLQPTQRFYFREHQLYGEGTELCFEEIRGRKWQEQKQREDEKKRTQRLEEEVEILRQQVAMLLQNQLKRQEAAAVAPRQAAAPVSLEQVSLPHMGDKSSVGNEYSVVRKFFADTEQIPSDVVLAARADTSSPTTSKSGLLEATATTTNLIPVKKPDAPQFAIFEDQTTNLQSKKSITETVPAKSDKSSKQKIEIYTDENEPAAEPKSGAGSSVGDVSTSEAKLTDSEDLNNFTRGYDFSINPVGFMRRESITFMIPSETEFIQRKSIVASTPNIEKRHVSRTKQPLQEQQPASTTMPSAPTTTTDRFQGGLTGKLSPINETSREYKSSSSSSSSSAAHTTHGTTTNSTLHQTKPRCRALSGSEVVNPFDPQLIRDLLLELEEPIEKRRGFFFVSRMCPKIKPGITSIKLGTEKYMINDLRDEGAYAKIYAAQINDINLTDETGGLTQNLTKLGQSKWYALKVCRPPNPWEFYISNELHKRMARGCGKAKADIECSVMMSNPAVLYRDASILVDELCPNGTLIRIINVLKAHNKQFPKSLTAYFALELLMIVRELHVHEIIHADVKPDNVLLLNMPTKEELDSIKFRTSCLKLIDFGRAIDMRLLPPNVAFTYKVETKGSQCPEMIEGKPWNYHTDWFGVLDCIHSLIFLEYISLQEGKTWNITHKFNKRNHLKDIWDPLFEGLLNLSQNARCPPIADQAIIQLGSYVQQNQAAILKESLELGSLLEQANQEDCKKR